MYRVYQIIEKTKYFWTGRCWSQHVAQAQFLPQAQADALAKEIFATAENPND